MARGPLDRLSVRARLTLAVTAWTGIALAVTGLAVDRVAEHRVMTEATETTQEIITAFRAMLEARPEAAASEVARDFARDAVLGPDLSAVAVIDGSASSSATTPPAHRDAALRATATLTDGGTTRVESDGTRLTVAVTPVRDGGTAAHLVVLAAVDEPLEGVRDLMVTYALICLAILVVSALSAWWIAGGILSPLRRLHRTAESISAGDLERRVEVTGSDDLSRLQQTVNSMLDRLATAFTAQRDLLDDVSHELRTPLTVMRGQLETVDPHDPAAIREIHEVVLDEIDRTARLVDDLGVLADSRRPDFVQVQRVPLGPLVDRIAQKATVLGDRAWSTRCDPGLTARLDPERLTQAVLQLVDNAVRHTQDGDVVAIEASADRDDVVIAVRDSGSGVDPADRELIFRRFGRGGADRSGSTGHGLGLTIVAAIAEAHGGSLNLADHDPFRPGATFRLRLPGDASA